MTFTIQVLEAGAFGWIIRQAHPMRPDEWATTRIGGTMFHPGLFAAPDVQLRWYHDEHLIARQWTGVPDADVDFAINAYAADHAVSVAAHAASALGARRADRDRTGGWRHTGEGVDVVFNALPTPLTPAWIFAFRDQTTDENVRNATARSGWDITIGDLTAVILDAARAHVPQPQEGTTA